MKGTVKWWNDTKGYGFITDENGEDIFVHFSSIDEAGFQTLKEGETVFFRRVDGPKGPQAFQVLRDRYPRPWSRPSPGTLEPIRPLRIFLSHSSGDKATVRELSHRLRADGFDPWLDEEQLLPG